MNEQSDKLKNIVNNILILSRNELYVAMRFLDIALSSLNFVYDENINRIATDGENLYFNSDYIINKYKENRIAINRDYLHSVMHCIFKHLFNTQKRDKVYWDIACDIVVESILDDLNYSQISDLSINKTKRNRIYNLLKEEMKVLTADKVYFCLTQNKLSDEDIDFCVNEFYRDDHNYWNSYHKKQENNDDENNNNDDCTNQSNKSGSNDLNNSSDEHNDSQENGNSNTKEQNKDTQNSNSMNNQNFSSKSIEDKIKKWENVSSKMQVNLETFSKSQGTENGSLLKQISIENREKYDYKGFLRKFAVLKEELIVDDDTFDYIFYTYGLTMYDNMPLIEPLEYKDVERVEEFVIAIDTSGSCDGFLIKSFIEQTYQILKSSETFARKVNIHIIQCDTVIQEDYKVTSREELEEYIKNFRAKGFGGTDFRPVFNYVNNLVHNKEFNNLKGLIYFTDGYGTFPSKRTSYDTAFVFLEEDDYSDVDVPPWAIKLILRKNDIIER